MTSVNPVRRGERIAQISAFYRLHADRIRHRVAAQVNAPAQRGAHWLAKVAIHEGWRLASTGRDVPAGAELEQLHTLHTTACATTDAAELALDRIEQQQRVADLAALKPRERRDLYLKVLGYRYEEIAELTGSTYTAVILGRPCQTPLCRRAGAWTTCRC